VIAGLTRSLSQCPALRRAFACGALVGALAACHLSPRAVLGVPHEEPWLVLPLKTWFAEDRAEPEAIALCHPPICGPGLVVGVVRLTGHQARVAEASLREPGILVRALSTPKDPKAPVRTAASSRSMEEGASRGFALTLQRRDGSRPAHGAALGQRFGPDLRLVLVIGEEAQAVEATARRVAREHLGSSDVVSPPFSL
jgi:hypothetical protein